MNRIALIDADIYIYEAASAVETPIDWGDGLWTLHAEETEAEAALYSRIEDLADAVEADHTILALSDPENFRHKILPTYKSNRKGTRKPMLIPHLRLFVADQWETFQRPGLEGDDVLGILATWGGLKGDKVIITGDKDMNTIPGKVYMSHKPELGVVNITPEQARYYHMMQTLTGDATDGYSGCPSVGPKTAEKILKKVEEEWEPVLGAVPDYWPAVVQQYEKKGLSEEEALVQARVAYILQASHYDFHNRQPILWNP